jgi:hypothetical protein
MDTHYEVVFEVGYFSNGTLFVHCGMLAIIALVTLVHLHNPEMSRRQKALMVVFMLFWSGYATFLIYYTISNVAEKRQALRNGGCEVVEGRVEIVKSSRKSDTVKIGSTDFRVNNFILGTQYRQTIPTGGVLTEGRQARVHLYQNLPVKVEIVR